jgi:hypothetical protein
MSNNERPPALDPKLVNEFVMMAHGNLNRVKELLEQEPQLLNASWDWGGGDWENALEAAAHTASRDIALFLLSKGARMNIFVAAMLGELEVVKAIVAFQPEVLSSTGAHGIPLLRHAEIGGEAATDVLAYLQTYSTQ